MTARLAGWTGKVFGAVAAAIVALAGCSAPSGPALYPVTGAVFVNGKPAAGAVVCFHRVGDLSKEDLPHGVVAADGSFSLTTKSPGDGAAAGKYAVTVVWRSKTRAKGDDTGVLLVDKRYLDPQTSGLAAEIGSGPIELQPFRLTN